MCSTGGFCCLLLTSCLPCKLPVVLVLRLPSDSNNTCCSLIWQQLQKCFRGVPGDPVRYRMANYQNVILHLRARGKRRETFLETKSFFTSSHGTRRSLVCESLMFPTGQRFRVSQRTPRQMHNGSFIQHSIRPWPCSLIHECLLAASLVITFSYFFITFITVFQLFGMKMFKIKSSKLESQTTDAFKTNLLFCSICPQSRFETLDLKVLPLWFADLIFDQNAC